MKWFKLGHISIFIELEDNNYIVIDNKQKDVEFNIVSKNIVNINIYENPYVITNIKINRKIFPIIPTCVGLTKAILGIKNPFILTPGQLYRHFNSS